MISVIIRTFNEERYLPELIASIQRQSVGDPVEIIVVDSESTDATRRIAQSAGCRVMDIRKSEFTFGGSLNTGCEAANGSILVLISGHCVPCSDSWLRDLTRPFRDPMIGVTYGRQLGGPETKFSEHQIFAKYFPPHPQPSQVGFFCNNANSALRKTLWKRFRFDENLTGLEDMHFGKQAVNAGYSVQYTWRAAVHHYHHETWRQVQRRFEREAMALRDIMPEVQLGLGDALRYIFSGALNDCSAALAQRSLRKHLFPILRYRYHQYRGAYRGHHQHRRQSAQERERYFNPR